MKPRYGIPRPYRARSFYVHHDDRGLRDEWQLEVYLYALGLLRRFGGRSVLDIGCGSGFKLVTYFAEYETLGLELPSMVDYLRETHPDRQWEAIDLDRRVSYEADVVICADVIEHVVDPQRLLDFVDGCRFRHLVISTPARDLLYRPWGPCYWGPPRNRTHQREWTRREFRAFVGGTFEVLDQRVIQFDQRTQMLVCLKRSGGRRPSLDDSLAKRRGRRLFRNA